MLGADGTGYLNDGGNGKSGGRRFTGKTGGGGEGLVGGIPQG